MICREETILHELPRILLLERDALIASDLAIALEKAGADVITADHSVQALQRLTQFTFSGAAIDYWPGADDRARVVERLLQLSVPFVVHTLVEPPAEWRAPRVAEPERIVDAVMRLIRSPSTP
jgi:ActR/RegA family two-component response regulator